MITSWGIQSKARGAFVQVLKLCKRAGLVKLGHVALDGTKIKANASKQGDELRAHVQAGDPVASRG